MICPVPARHTRIPMSGEVPTKCRLRSGKQNGKPHTSGKLHSYQVAQSVGLVSLATDNHGIPFTRYALTVERNNVNKNTRTCLQPFAIGIHTKATVDMVYIQLDMEVTQ